MTVQGKLLDAISPEPPSIGARPPGAAGRANFWKGGEGAHVTCFLFQTEGGFKADCSLRIRPRWAYQPPTSSGASTRREASTHRPVSEKPMVIRTKARNPGGRKEVKGAPKGRSPGRGPLPPRTPACNLMWESMMVAQPPMMPSAETSSTISKTCDGTI